MIQRRFPLLFAAFFVLAPLNLGAQPVAVTFDAGLVSISCQNAPLSAVFDMLEEVTGIELILEDAVKSTKLSADLTATERRSHRFSTSRSQWRCSGYWKATA